MRCQFRGKSGKYCQNKIDDDMEFCLKHDPERVLLYFMQSYAGYKKLSSHFVDATLAEWFMARGVAVKRDGQLYRAANRIGAYGLCLIRTRSEERLAELLCIVRIMIAHGNELFLFRFFNTKYEPHFKIVQDFITHEWFTDEERVYLGEFINTHFIQRRTLRHQINDLVRERRKAIRLKKKSNAFK